MLFPNNFHHIMLLNICPQCQSSHCWRSSHRWTGWKTEAKTFLWFRRPRGI